LIAILFTRCDYTYRGMDWHIIDMRIVLTIRIAFDIANSVLSVSVFSCHLTKPTRICIMREHWRDKSADARTSFAPYGRKADVFAF